MYRLNRNNHIDQFIEKLVFWKKLNRLKRGSN